MYNFLFFPLPYNFLFYAELLQRLYYSHIFIFTKYKYSSPSPPPAFFFLSKRSYWYILKADCSETTSLSSPGKVPDGKTLLCSPAVAARPADKRLRNGTGMTTTFQLSEDKMKLCCTL